MSLILNKLVPEHIDEKIVLNENAGIDIFTLQEMIKAELSECTWAIIRSTVQKQFYKEQLEHIEKQIKKFESTGVKGWVPPEAPKG